MAATIPPSRLTRSRSGAPSGMSVVASYPEKSSRSYSQRYSPRSKPTTSPASGQHHENATTTLSSRTRRNPQCQDNVSYQASPGSVTSRKARSAPPSPSAWMPPPPRSRTSAEAKSTCSSGVVRSSKTEGGGGISRVLKYFRMQKKASPAQEDDFHRFRMLQNRLLQWGFVNARAEAVKAAVELAAEEKLLRVWLRITKLRYSVAEKRTEMQRLMDCIKLYDIIIPQIHLLNRWEDLEKKYNEGVGRMIRKLSAFSNNIPLLHGAEADVVALGDALRLSSEVMDNLVTICIKFSKKAEEVHPLLVQASDALKLHGECAQQLENILHDTLTLLAEEQSLRVNLIQSANSRRRSQRQITTKPMLPRETA